MVVHGGRLHLWSTLWLCCSLLAAILHFHPFEATRFESNCGNQRLVFGPEHDGTTFGRIDSYQDEAKFSCEWLIAAGWDEPSARRLNFINLRLISSGMNCTSDVVYVFDGPSYEDTLIAAIKLTGQSDNLPVLSASSGHMLLLHYFPESSIPSNFTAQYSITQCPLNCSDHGSCVDNRCQCDYFWGGEACEIDLCPAKCSLAGHCRNNTLSRGSKPEAACFEESSYGCECTAGHIGQSCDVAESEWTGHWRLLFSNDKLFRSRASHSSAYDPMTDTIYTFGGRAKYEITLGDLLAYSVVDNRWHNLSHCLPASAIRPKPLWAHTLNAFNSTLLLFGGIFTNGTLSNELWHYEISTKKWSLKQTSNVIPGLAFHTATVVDAAWLYIFGGRFQNGSHSSSFYRISLAEGHPAHWQSVHPLNGKPFDRQLAGHTAIFYKPLRSIVIFGGALLMGERKARLSNDLYLFNIDSRIWSKLEHSLPQDAPLPAPRAFHSMLLVEHYLLVFGGHTEDCSENRLFVYSLICHKWSDFDSFMSTLPWYLSGSHFPFGGLVSHSAVLRHNLVFTLGGFSSHLRNEVYVFKLPKVLFNASQYELCSRLRSKLTCNLSPYCFWCPSREASYCAHYELKCSSQLRPFNFCPGLCGRLGSCYSCVAFNELASAESTSDIGEDEDEMDGHSLLHQLDSCLWDSRQLHCLRRNISESDRIYDHLLASQSDCTRRNIEAGLTFLNYYYPQNLSQPDQVAILQHSRVQISFRERLARNHLIEKSKVAHYSSPNRSANDSLVNIGRILGFVHPFDSYKKSPLRLYLASTSPHSTFHLNGHLTSLTNMSQEAAHLWYIDVPDTNSSDLLEENSNFLVDFIVRFPIRTVSRKLEFETMELGVAEDEFPLKVFSSSKLTPYRDELQCKQLPSCLACLSNQACAWCSTVGLCVTRANLSQCLSDQEADNVSVVIDAEQCSTCDDFLDCLQCVTSDCEWAAQESRCLRRGRFATAIRQPTSCPLPCNLRNSCALCLDDSLSCAWCQLRHQCISAASYQYLPDFEFCQQYDAQLFMHNAFFLNKRFLLNLRLNHSQILCDKCLYHSSCLLCEQIPSCGWCHLHSDSSQGFCAVKEANNLNECNLSAKLLDNAEENALQDDWHQMTSVQNGTCPLVDECQLGLHNCHPIDALCINTEHSFQCSCRPGFTGDGLNCARTCEYDCVHGYCSEFPDYQCICDLGWTGSTCNVDCGCNYHSTCQGGPGKCDKCEDNTTGDQCEQCSVGFFATNSSTGAFSCQICECNDHSRNHNGESHCDQSTGACHCSDNTEGEHCERCQSGFYGDAHNGGHCFLECQHRAMLAEVEEGFFGSYLRDIHFNKRHNLQDHLLGEHITCLWIFTSHKSPKSFDSFSSYHSSLANDALPAPISVTIFGSSQLNCSSSRVSVYDGIPRFVSASIQMRAITLVNMCGKDARADTRVIATSGFVTVFYSSNNLNQGFNASFAKVTLSSTDTQDNTTFHSPTDQAIRQTIWQSQSNHWPKWHNPLFFWDDLLLFVGGRDAVHLSLTVFNVSSKRWHEDESSMAVRPPHRQFAAIVAVEKTIFIHGGLSRTNEEVFRDMWSCHQGNSSLHFKWSRIEASGQVTIPPLLGHTLTAITFATEPAFLLVGGYSPSDGFSQSQFVYLRESNQWQTFITKGASTIGVFGHSAVFHEASNSVYVFGGVHFKYSQKSALSNSLYILNLATAVWHRVRSSDAATSGWWPPPSFLHLVASTPQFMLITVGYSNNENIDHSAIWAYRFNCNSWMPLNGTQLDAELANLTAPQRRPRVHSLAFNSSDDQLLLYLYETEIGVEDSATMNWQISVIQIPFDLCSLHSRDRKTCLTISGCSFCANSMVNVQNSFGRCFDSSTPLPDECSPQDGGSPNQITIRGPECNSQKQSLPCTAYTNCIDCATRNYELGSGEESCQWCTDCREKQGRCIALNDTCDWLRENHTDFYDLCEYSSVEDVSMCRLRRCLATDCDKCLQIAQAQPGKPGCIWTRQVFGLVKVGHNTEMNPVLDWTCIDSTVIKESLLPNVETVPPLACPARCHKHRTCSLCLEAATGDESGSHECVWSEMTQECMSPTYAFLRCSNGRCGGLLHRKFYAQCPADCESHTKASDCLAASHCGWCAVSGFELDGVGLCLRGGLFGSVKEPCTGGNVNLLALLMKRPFYKPISSFSAQWHYLFLPKENECANGHHSCNPMSQECIDLEEGYMCRCKPGYILEESTGNCRPLCLSGCLHGVCVQPNSCECNFGYVGSDCALQCQCNGHGSCQPDNLDKCIECYNNTMGQFCEKCRPFFVGDPQSGGTCTSCEQYCHTHSTKCFSEDLLNSSLATATANAIDSSFFINLASKVTEGVRRNAVCIDCQNNTEGEKCDRCRLGFFKISDDIRDGCRQCSCGQHGWLCNPFNGENCNCQNNTENDRQCNYLNTKEYSSFVNKTYFYKSAQTMTTYSLPCWMMQCSKCKDTFYGLPTNGHQCYRHMIWEKEYCLDPDQDPDCFRNPQPLLFGRTIFFGIQPKYMNVDIKIVLNVLQGEVDLYMASKDDLFVVQTNQSNGIHHTFFDKNYIQPQFSNISSSDMGLEKDKEQHLWWLSVESETLANYAHTIRKPFYLREYHLGSLGPHYFNVESFNEITIFRKVISRLEVTIPHRTQDLRNTRYFLVLRGNFAPTIGPQGDQNLGYILWRQDQCRIDLFVFFSVFFSSFFLFLCFSVLTWKVKQFADNRRLQHLQQIELEHMASRPFARIFLFTDSLNTPDLTSGFRKPSASVQGTPAKKMSIFRHLALGFRETPKIYPEGVYSTARLSEKTPESLVIRPIAVEPTSDLMACVLTTLVQMPGGIMVPNRLAAATTLVSLRHSPQLVQQFNFAK